MKNRIIAFFLCALIAGSTAVTLSSCADNDQTNNNGSGVASGSGSGLGDDVIPTNPEEDNGPGVSGVNFANGDQKLEINFAIAETDAYTGDTFHLRSIKLDPDEVLESDKVDVAIEQRNAQVEYELGVEIVVYDYVTDNNIRASRVYTALMGQTDEYDVIAGLQWNDVQLCLEDLLVDLNDLYDEETNKKIDYLSLDKPWWSTYYIDAMKCGDAIYWLTGDLCLRYTGGFYCFFVNERLYQENLYYSKSDLLTRKNGEDTEYGSIYDLVTRGDWTLDILNEMIAKCYYDNNGNEKVDREDILGCALPVWDNTNGMSIAAGVEYSRRAGDTIMLTATSSNQTLFDFMSKMYTILKSGYVYNYSGSYDQAMNDFAADGACFISGRLNQAELFLKDMTTDYHIIPCPKMDFDQKQYRSSVHDGINLYGISVFSQNKVATAATLELMAYYSYYVVRPIYYDQALKNLYTTDEGAGAMIDLMGEVVYSDFVYIWQFSDYFGNTNGGGGMGDFLRRNVTSSKPSSQIKKQEKVWSNGLEKVLDEIKQLEADHAAG